ERDYFLYIVRLCTRLKALVAGRRIHEQLVQMGIAEQLPLAKFIVQMYLSCGSLDEARNLFDLLPSKDVGMWTAVIAAYAKYGRWQEAIKLFETMESRTGPAKATYFAVMKSFASAESLAGARLVHSRIVELGAENDDLVRAALIEMYGRCGSLEEAWSIFSSSVAGDGGPHSVLVWNAIISASFQNGQLKGSLELFWKMRRQGVRPDSLTLATALDTCAASGNLHEGRVVHGWITMKGLEQDVFVGNALVDMYGKCGSVEEAWAVFDNMKEKNWFSWNFMVEAYCSSGYSTEAIQVFLQMLQEGVKPNAKTFTSVLVACGHAGFIREGILHLVYMSSDYDVVPIAEHYACAVGLLGRSGWVKEAEEYVKKLPDAEAPVWDALVTACRIHGDLDRGRSAAESLLECSPHAARSYAVVAGLYNALARSDDAARVRETMTSKGLTEERVTSSILVGNTTCHEFITADTRHKRIQGIHAELEDLGQRIAKDGYAPDASKLLMHERAEEQRQESLFYHSERLAVGLGAIKIRGDCPLRIIRNFRMCADCHTAIKFMSKAMGRTIILRDGSSQLHRFVDGHCACRDYW
ncbi:hypothetical protein SELMODRAFT_132950, partial [Selaginella moellendorffii]